VTLRRPIETFEACPRHAFVTASRFARMVSTVSIKLWVDYCNCHLFPFVIALNLLLLSRLPLHSPHFVYDGFIL
jgi:hypothetical protein